MTHHRSAISLIGFCLTTALGAALAFGLVVAGGAVALASHQSPEDPQKDRSKAETPLTRSPVAATFNGVITDSHCGARHQKRSGQNSADCARACVRKGAAYVLVDGDKRYRLAGGDDALDKVIGQRANVTGTRQGDTIAVTSAAPVLLP